MRTALVAIHAVHSSPHPTCYGGLEIKVSARFDPACPMAQCLGEQDYRRLWDAYRSERLSLPLLHRRRLADIRREIVEHKAGDMLRQMREAREINWGA